LFTQAAKAAPGQKDKIKKRGFSFPGGTFLKFIRGMGR
jgi:hypothetical protein